MFDFHLYTVFVCACVQSRQCWFSSRVCVCSEPPVLVLKSHNLDRIPSASAKFSCYFSAQPAAQITWWHNGVRLRTGSGTGVRLLRDGSELIIEQSRHSDSGYYQCVAVNAGGSASAIVYLYVRRQHGE